MKTDMDNAHFAQKHLDSILSNNSDIKLQLPIQRYTKSMLSRIFCATEKY